MARQIHVAQSSIVYLKGRARSPAQFIKFTVSAIRNMRTILKFMIAQFVLHHVNVQTMIPSAIMHAYRNSGSCIPPRVLSISANPSDVTQPPREQVRFVIHSLINQATSAVLHDHDRQGVRQFEFETRTCR
jgi:hypothetical protein